MRKIYFTAFRRKLLLFFFLIVLFAGNAHAQVDFAIGTGTTGNANTTYPCPLQDYYEGSRMQYLYRASELTAAGMFPGNILGIKYNVISLATSANMFFAIEQFTIKMGTTSATTLGTTTWETVNTTVYGPTNYMAVLGVNNFTFSSPFLWNGTDNIVIEICGGEPNSASDIFYTGNPVIAWTTGLGFNGSHNYRADNVGNLCGTTTTTNTGDQTTRPNIIFTAAPAVPCSGTPEAGTAISSKLNVCAGENFTLSLTGNTLAAALTYRWQSSTDNISWSDITGATSGFYTTNQAVSHYYRNIVTCTNGGASDTSVVVQVTVLNGPPVATIVSSPADTVCNGTSVTLTTTSCSGCTYLWNTGAATNSINVTAAGYYTVNVINSCGNDNDSKEIIYKPSPSLSINAANAVCVGSSTQLEANGASTYSWSPATGLNTTTGAVVIAMPSVTTTYTVTGFIGSCSRNLSVTVTVNAIPAAPAVSASGVTSFCAVGSVTLTSSSAVNNQWYKDGVIITGATNQNYNATASGSYTTKVTSNNCISNASAATAVTVNPIPSQPVITQAGNSLQSSASNGNQWFLNGLAVTGATSATHTPVTSGQYTVQVTTNGCTSAASAIFNFIVTAVSNPVLDRKITIAPNPVRDNLLVKYTGNASKFSLTMVNINGTVLLKSTFTTNYDIDMRKYSAGLYIIRIIDEKRGDVVQRMIIKQ